MAGSAPPSASRSFRIFILGLVFFAVGGFLFGVSFIVVAMGSLEGNTPAILGLGFMVAGFVLAGSKLD